MKPIQTLLVALIVSLMAIGNTAIAADKQGRSKADAAYKAGKYKAAVAGYKEWVKTHPKDYEAWFRLGNSYNNIIEPIDALTAWRAAQKINPKDPRAWHNMGMLYLRMSVESYDNLRKHVPKKDPMARYSNRAINDILRLIRKVPKQK